MVSFHQVGIKSNKPTYLILFV